MVKNLTSENSPVEKVGEFHCDGILFVVVSWGGKPAAYIPGCCGVVELSGWGLDVKHSIMQVWNKQ